MKKSLLLICLALLAAMATAQVIGSKYVLDTNVAGFLIGNNRVLTVHIAGRGTQFEFLDIHEDTYTIKISKTGKIEEEVFTAFTEKYTKLHIPVAPVDTDIYRIAKDDLQIWMFRYMSSFSHGPLAIPFRLRFGASGPSLSAGGSLGYYIGYSWNVEPISITPLFSSGLSLIPVVDINDSALKSELGIYGVVGVAFKLYQQMQFGVLAGMDFVGKGWEYDWKPWISFGVGVAFIN